MNVVIYIIAALIVSTLLWFVTRKNAKKKTDGSHHPRPVPEQTTIAGGVRRKTRRSRIQKELERQQQQQEESEKEEDQDSDENENDSDDEVKKAPKKIGVKKMKKLQLKEQKKVAREAVERERAEKKAEDAKKEEARLEQEEKDKIEKVAEEAELQRQKEEQEQREHEEYLKLATEFEIEEEGEEREDIDGDSDHRVEDFINYIKETKVVFLEDLASHFGMRTQEAIDRVQSLLAAGDITGVIDDRGKFIYITVEELKTVADFIKQRGRVSIAEIARASNSLINIQPESELKLTT